MPDLSRIVLSGPCIGLAMLLALSFGPATGHAQDVSPNPRNVAAIAAGKEAVSAIEAQLADLRASIGRIEAADREAHAAKVYAAWLDGQLALGHQSFVDASVKARPVVEARAVEARNALEAARAWREAQRTDLSARLSGIAFDQRAAVQPELEAILNHETTQVNVATELGADFDLVLKSLDDGAEPYALFNARKPMNEQAAALYRPAIAGIEASIGKLKALTVAPPAPVSAPIYNPPASAPVYNPPAPAN